MKSYYSIRISDFDSQFESRFDNYVYNQYSINKKPYQDLFSAQSSLNLRQGLQSK